MSLSLLWSLVAVFTIVPVSAGDEAALLAFKAQLSHGGSLASWNSSVGFCSWQGVTCNHRRPARVVALGLNGTGLVGALSAAIGNLTFLRTLDLSINSLHGDIPASLGPLRRLQWLYLDDNSFSGTIPANLSTCVSMTEMRLDNNMLGESIPAELGEKLTYLALITMRNNSFTGSIPVSLANLSHLQIFDLSDNQLSGSIPPGLGSIQSMRYFNLAINLHAGMLPPSLYNWSSLELFAIGSNMLYGIIPGDIGNKFPNMKVLSLPYNQFTGVLPLSLSNMSDLTELQVGGNRFGGYVPPTLGKLGALQELNLLDNKLEANDNKSWEFITSLTNCTQLHNLILSINSFEGQLPGSIVNLSTTLRQLYLMDNMFFGSIPVDIGNLISLEVLAIGNNSISGVIPESIGKLENMIDLTLYNNSLSGLIPSSLGNLSQLTRLYAHHSNLEGAIPTSLGELKNLFALDLKMNFRLNGSIPREIFKLPSLSWILDLSYNSLSGPIHDEVGSLANLNNLILSGNQLSGKIPGSIQNCIVLEWLLLDNNSFEGSIPQSLTNINGLSVLDLTMNKFSGNIPDTLCRIRNLRELYLARNNLSGPIPLVLQNLTSLVKLDVSFNNLQGDVPNEGVFRNITYLAVAGNINLCGGTPQLHLAPCSISKKERKMTKSLVISEGVFRNITYLAVAGNINLCGGTPQLHLAPCSISKNERKMTKSLVISLATAGGILFSLLVILVVWIHCKKLKLSQKILLAQNSIDDYYMRIAYHTLWRGTNEFSEDNLLGRGSYGAVYKCVLDTKQTLAVKVFHLGHSRYSKSFEAECEAMRRIRHRCLLKIITTCSSVNHQGQEFKALIFQFMPNGNLHDWLHPKSQEPTTNNTLSLAQRLHIVVDIVDAVEYLHNNCQPLVVHCDLKPSNILLAGDMSARVGDFGISRILQENISEGMQTSYSSNGIRGSVGYVAPEYGEGSAVSTAGDIYSLGILLLEMFSGRRPTEGTFRDSLGLHMFADDALPHRALEIADPTMWLHSGQHDNTTNIIIQECLVSVFKLGLSCSKAHSLETEH